MKLEERVERVCVFEDMVQTAWKKYEQAGSPVAKHAMCEVLERLEKMRSEERLRIIGEHKQMAADGVLKLREGEVK